jgi:hypothetical protein
MNNAKINPARPIRRTIVAMIGKFIRLRIADCGLRIEEILLTLPAIYDSDY